MKILLVEDDANLREVTQRSLERSVMWWKLLPITVLHYKDRGL